jgi:hypothetical protein
LILAILLYGAEHLSGDALPVAFPAISRQEKWLRGLVTRAGLSCVLHQFETQELTSYVDLSDIDIGNGEPVAVVQEAKYLGSYATRAGTDLRARASGT